MRVRRYVGCNRRIVVVAFSLEVVPHTLRIQPFGDIGHHSINLLNINLRRPCLPAVLDAWLVAVKPPPPRCGGDRFCDHPRTVTESRPILQSGLYRLPRGKKILIRRASSSLAEKCQGRFPGSFLALCVTVFHRHIPKRIRILLEHRQRSLRLLLQRWRA